MLAFVRRVPTGVRAWNTCILPAAFSTAAGAPCWASVNPTSVSGATPHTVQNLLAGNWVDATTHDVLPDPMNGEEVRAYLCGQGTRRTSLTCVFASAGR